MKRLVVSILVIAMFTAMLGGCANNPGTAPTAAPPAATAAATVAPQVTAAPVQATAAPPEITGVSYPLEGNPTLTLALAESTVISGISAYKDTPFITELQKRTGVTLEIEHPADFPLLFASGDYPDLIFYQFQSYPGGYAKAVKDKIALPLNDLLETSAPDFKAVLDGNDVYKKSATTPDGDIIGFNFIRGDASLLTSNGIMLRKDWLDELSIPVPETADEFYEALLAFRDKKGATAPFSSTYANFRGTGVGDGILTGAFGLPRARYYIDNGKVHFGYSEAAYKDALIYLNKLYTDGLLDQNFATIDAATANANIMGGVSGALIGALSGGMGNYLSTMENKGEPFDLVGMSSLVANKGETALSGSYTAPVPGPVLAVTTACKNPEIAAKFGNYAYSEEGHMLYNFGIEGESYEMVDGYPKYTDKIMKNPDGLTPQQMQGQYMRSWVSDAFVQDKRFMEQTAFRPQQQEALVAWMKNDVTKIVLPNTIIADANSSEYSRIWSDLETHVDEMFVKFISGTESIETGFDTYINTLKTIGVDRVIELQQTAYDEYMSR